VHPSSTSFLPTGLPWVSSFKIPQPRSYILDPVLPRYVLFTSLQILTGRDYIIFIFESQSNCLSPFPPSLPFIDKL
jgi:hypothetical protein